MKIEWTLKRRIRARKENFYKNLPWCADGVKKQIENKDDNNFDKSDYYATVRHREAVLNSIREFYSRMSDGRHRNIFTGHIQDTFSS